jgi:hypothetical protein
MQLMVITKQFSIMAYHRSAKNVELEGLQIYCECRTFYGGWIPASIDLNCAIGNDDGSFAPGNDFTTTARNIRYELTGDGDVKIIADLRDKRGHWAEDQECLASMFVKNHDGHLTAA